MTLNIFTSETHGLSVTLDTIPQDTVFSTSVFTFLQLEKHKLVNGLTKNKTLFNFLLRYLCPRSVSGFIHQIVIVLLLL